MASNNKDACEFIPAKSLVGRPKGTKNPRKMEILAIIQQQVNKKFGIEDWHPIVEMALYAADPNGVVVLRDGAGHIEYDKNDNPIILERIDPGLRQRCLEQLAQYVAPKLKAIELTPAAMGERFTLNYSLSVDGEVIDELAGEESDD